jgi:uncharacterized protein YbbC (DUF1343 family)
VYGHPDFQDKNFYYMPKTNPGAKEPKHKNMLCYGVDLRNIKIDAIQSEKEINLSYIISAYEKMDNLKDFFNNYFNYLAGNDILKTQIIDGLTEEQIRSSWQNDISHFKTIRKKYLLYTDFE